MNNKSLKTTGLLRLKIKIKIFLAVFSLLTVSVSLYTSAINENSDNSFFMINNDMDNDCSLAGFESQNKGTMQNHPPETPDTPLGPTFIEAGIQYIYCAFTHDPDDDLIRYRFDWGDGSISNWTHWETSNIPVSMSHIWTAISTFNIKVIAQDENGLNSSWSPALVVTSSQVKPKEIPSFVDKSTDNFEKFIWNSNGNHWEPTGANIQAAIDDLEDNGGSVLLPEGVFNVSVASIKLDNNMNLIGQGNSTILNLTDDFNGAGSHVIEIKGKHNVSIENIQIDGNKDINRDKYWYGISISGESSNVTIQKCYIHDTQHSMINGGPNTSKIVVENCYLRECNTTSYPGGIRFKGCNCVARNNFIKDTYACGIIFENNDPNYPSHNNVADGNIITGSISRGIHLEWDEKSENITVTNNYIHDLTGTCYISGNGIGIWGGTGDNNKFSDNQIVSVNGFGIKYGGSDSLIKDNQIMNTGDVGIELTGGGRNNIVIGNYVLNTVGCGIRFHYNASFDNIAQNNVIINSGRYGISSEGQNNTIVGNVIKDSKSASIQIIRNKCVVANNTIHGGTTGIFLYYVNNCVVSGNNISNSTGSGIILQADNTFSAFNIVSNNSIYNAGNNGITINGIGNIVSKNIVKYSKYRGIHAYKVRNSMIIGNVCKKNGISSPGYGIALSDAHNCTITKNEVLNNHDRGIFESHDCCSNAIVDNDLYDL